MFDLLLLLLLWEVFDLVTCSVCCIWTSRLCCLPRLGPSPVMFPMFRPVPVSLLERPRQSRLRGVLLGDVAVEVERFVAVLLDQVVGQRQPICEVSVGEARQTQRPQTVPAQLSPHQRSDGEAGGTPVRIRTLKP